MRHISNFDLDDEELDPYVGLDHMYDDIYLNEITGCDLPHDSILDDPVELAKLSGPCITIKKGVGKREQRI